MKIFFFLAIMLMSISLFICKQNSTNADLNAEVDSKDLNIVEITQENFDNLSEENNMLLLYEADKCDICRTLKPYFLRLAKIAKESNYTIATLDVDLYPKLYKRFEANNKGILRLIKKGLSPGIPYWGLYNDDNLLKWWGKFSGNLYVDISNINQINDYTSKADTIIFLGKKRDNNMHFYHFEDICGLSYESNFLLCQSKECREHFQAEENSLVYIKAKENTNKILHPDFDLDKAKKFLLYNTLDIILDPSEENMRKIGLLKIPLLVIYANSDDKEEKLNSYKLMLRSVITKFNDSNNSKDTFSKFLGVVSKVNQDSELLKTTLKPRESFTPTAFLIEFTNEKEMKKFMVEDNTQLTEESLQDFIIEYSQGKLENYYFSEEEPNEDNEYENGILKLVGNSFERQVIKNKNDVMVFVHVPWCGYCQQFKNIYESLRRKLKSSDKLVLAKIDASLNDLNPKYVQVHGYPTILFFKGNNKPNYIEYQGERQIYLIEKFLNKHGTYVPNHEEEL